MLYAQETAAVFVVDIGVVMDSGGGGGGGGLLDMCYPREAR